MIHTENNVVYPEVEGLSVLMGYKTANAGCCKVRGQRMFWLKLLDKGRDEGQASKGCPRPRP